MDGRSVIMVAGVEAALLHIMRYALQATWDCTVVATASMEEALDVLGCSMPNLVIVELDLYDTWGDELVERLKDDEEYSRLPVILVSYYPKSVTPRADEFIQKPFDPEDLVRTASKYLGPSNAPPPIR